MKDFKEILKKAGVTVTDEQLAGIETEMKANYKPIADYNKQKEKLDASEEKVKTLTDSFEKFKNVDPTALNQTIEDLRAQLKTKDTEFTAKMADRDFRDLLSREIVELRGKNVKAITALLDVKALKGSKNQAEDVRKALKALSEAKDSAFLFDSAQPQAQGTINPIGFIQQSVATPNYLDEEYKGNPFYHPVKSGS